MSNFNDDCPADCFVADFITSRISFGLILEIDLAFCMMLRRFRLGVEELPREVDVGVCTLSKSDPSYDVESI